MGTSAGGNDGLFKLAETAAPDENRIMPPDRKYIRSSKTVSINEAISLMKQRKSDPSMMIPGGLDDNSEKARKSYKETSLKDAVRVSPGGIVQIEPITAPSTNTTGDTQFFQEIDAVPVKSGKKRASINSLLSALSALHKTIQVIASGMSTLHTMIQELKDSSAKQQDTHVDEEKEDKLAKFKEGTHRVTFMLNNMEFTVKCLNMTQDPVTHCLVLSFSDDSDSFFTPPMQSELRIKFDGEDIPGKLFYFGMSYRLRDLGLRFLGFLIDGTTEENV